MRRARKSVFQARLSESTGTMDRILDGQEILAKLLNCQDFLPALQLSIRSFI
jgi:hypothetical protein